VKKYNALSDALRQKLEELKLPGPGDALPPPARARLGVSVAAPGTDDAVANGVRVTAVSPGSRGEKLGLKNGDIIRKVNGKPVEDAASLRRTLTDNKDPLVLDVERGGVQAVLREKAQ
jgi:S1-C subfamily serine protease